MAFPIYRRNVILSLFSYYTFDPQHIHESRVLVSLTISLHSFILFLSPFFSFGSSSLRLLIQTEDVWSFMWLSDFNTNYRVKFISAVLLRVALQHFHQKGNISFCPHNALTIFVRLSENTAIFSVNNINLQPESRRQYND